MLKPAPIGHSGHSLKGGREMHLSQIRKSVEKSARPEGPVMNVEGVRVAGGAPGGIRRGLRPSWSFCDP